MKIERLDRRTVLKGIGGGVLGSAAVTGTATAGHTVDGDEDIELISTPTGHDFSPDSYTADSDETVIWEHADHTAGGIVHNVRIHEHGNDTKQLNSPRLALGDTYSVDFDLTGDILTLSDDRRSITIDVDGRDTVDFGVHCDYHLGQTDLEGSMKMEEFEVITQRRRK